MNKSILFVTALLLVVGCGKSERRSSTPKELADGESAAQLSKAPVAVHGVMTSKDKGQRRFKCMQTRKTITTGFGPVSGISNMGQVASGNATFYKYEYFDVISLSVLNSSDMGILANVHNVDFPVSKIGRITFGKDAPPSDDPQCTTHHWTEVLITFKDGKSLKYRTRGIGDDLLVTWEAGDAVETFDSLLAETEIVFD